jgi:hypothetical protein
MPDATPKIKFSAAAFFATALFHVRRWYLILLTASSVFLFRCYTIINNGLPWDKGLFTAQIVDRWAGWSNIAWVAYAIFLGRFVLKATYLPIRTRHSIEALATCDATTVC